MATLLEIAAGLVLAGAVATVMTILGAYELGRRISLDEEQREVYTTRADMAWVRKAA
jgi:hypothetical protein